MAEQMAPPPAGPEGAPAPGGEEAVDKLSELISNVSEGMTMLVDAVGTLDPGTGEQLASISQQFQEVMAKLGQGGGMAPAGQGQASPEVGGAKAMAASPAGIPRGR